MSGTTRPPTAFHWFLPTGGDGRRLGGSVHGVGIGARVD